MIQGSLVVSAYNPYFVYQVTRMPDDNDLGGLVVVSGRTDSGAGNFRHLSFPVADYIGTAHTFNENDVEAFTLVENLQ
jgi:hypothetical protein